MRDYLSNNERINMLFLRKYIDCLESMIKDWASRDNLTKEESRALKMAVTWGMKAFESILNRQCNKTLEVFNRSVSGAYITVQDKYAVDQYQRHLRETTDRAYKQQEEYYKMVELVMHTNCRNCNKDHKTCWFAGEFEERCIPEPTGYGKDNCRYAYDWKE